MKKEKAGRGHEQKARPEKRRQMTLAGKLTLSMLLVLTLALSVGGAAVMQGNFDDALTEAAAQAESQHLLYCYVIESDVMDITAHGDAVTEEHFIGYGRQLYEYTGENPVAIYRITGEEKDENAGRISMTVRTLYDSFPWQEAPSGHDEAYRIRRVGSKTYLLLETQIRTISAPPILLLTGHDVTNVFEARGSALWRFWEMEFVVLVFAGAVIALLARRLTKPLVRLTQASRSIASGAYDERTSLETNDEIGVLSESFDAMAQAVQEKVDALELSVQQREDFMGAFTHELKTPMTTVIGYADTLRSMQCEPELQHRAAGYIFSEAKRVEALSENLLKLLGLRDEAPQLAAVRLSELFAQTQRSIEPVIRPVKAEFADAQDITVYAERALMIDLLYNLIKNAATAKPKDGCVHIGWQKGAENAVDIFVQDTGIGIPAQALQRVTEPFYMVDKSRARAGGGSGMGLAVCRRIAELHGSQLQIESEEGRGTTVTVRLALKKTEGGAVQ